MYLFISPETGYRRADKTTAWDFLPSGLLPSLLLPASHNEDDNEWIVSKDSQ